MDLSANEKRLLVVLARVKSGDPATLAAELGVAPESVIQYAYLLSDRGLCEVEKEVRTTYALTEEGERYAREGLPERQLLERFSGRIPVQELSRHPLARIGIGQMKRKGWIVVRDGMVEKTGKDAPGEDELALRDLSRGGSGLEELKKRNLVVENNETRYRISITPRGLACAERGIDAPGEAGTLTREQIVSGAWKNLRLRGYNLKASPRRVYPGKIHPYQRVIEEMRKLLLSMGFSEIYGGIVQSAFWNFDALFQPQDHPAREMQDTFYLAEKFPLPEGWERVRDTHLSGGDTS
ncbi:MAG: phenylalanine--tRNA ligase subunit alpha, partial [Methanolinea sp.]